MLAAHAIAKTYRNGWWPRKRTTCALRRADVDLPNGSHPVSIDRFDILIVGLGAQDRQLPIGTVGPAGSHQLESWIHRWRRKRDVGVGDLRLHHAD